MKKQSFGKENPKTRLTQKSKRIHLGEFFVLCKYWVMDENHNKIRLNILDYIEKSGRPVETVDDLRELDNIYSYLTRKFIFKY